MKDGECAAVDGSERVCFIIIAFMSTRELGSMRVLRLVTHGL